MKQSKLDIGLFRLNWLKHQHFPRKVFSFFEKIDSQHLYLCPGIADGPYAQKNQILEIYLDVDRSRA